MMFDTEQDRLRWTYERQEEERRQGETYFYREVYLKICQYCGQEFYTTLIWQKYCPDPIHCVCRLKAQSKRQAERKKRKHLERLLYCQTCGEPIIGSRKDAKYCSNRCRQAAYRKALQIKDRDSADPM